MSLRKVSYAGSKPAEKICVLRERNDNACHISLATYIDNIPDYLEDEFMSHEYLMLLLQHTT